MIYTDDYLEQCFQVWYSMNQPVSIALLQEALPPTAEGNKPGIPLLRQTMEEHSWAQRADVMNAKAIEKVEHQLIDRKADMLKRQAEFALAIADKAREHILDNGFDTSASAVNAYFKASEEERVVRGVSEMLIKVSKMTPDELLAEAGKLLKRSSESIEGVVLEDNADISSATPQE